MGKRDHSGLRGMGILLVLLLLFMMGWYYSTHPDAYKILLDLGWRGLEL